MKFEKKYDNWDNAAGIPKYPMKEYGYKFLFDADHAPVGFGRSAEAEEDRRTYERRYNYAVDSLYDAACPICIGEDGELYGVQYEYAENGFEPYVWQRVCEDTDTAN